jgi:hypothetical protein
VTGDDLRRLSARKHPNLERTLFLQAAAPADPAALLSAVIEELRDAMERVRRLERRVAAVEELARRVDVAPGHTRFIARPSGYAFDETDEEVPVVGTRVTIEDELFEVVSLAASPLPADRRPCAVLAIVAA